MDVEIGDPVVFESTLTVLGKGNMIRGKALDNRVGCLALMEIMKRYEGDITLYGVGTTQEEVGLKGARTSTYGIDPDIGIALDTTTAGDTPEVKPSESTNKIGGGPVITIAEAAGRGLITSERVFRWLVKTAKTSKIPYQVEVGEGGMTDASIMYITRTGIPCGALSIPVRYIHGPSGVLNLKDLEHVILLLTEALKKVDTII
jgi:endoglucanase